jgi:hypothetical protein
MSSSLLCINGVYADTGEYLLPPLTIDEAAAIARAKPPEVETLEDLRIWFDEVTRARGVRGRPDLSDLSEVGWGVIFAADQKPPGLIAEIEKELAPLLEKRAAEAGRFFKICKDELGYQKGFDKEKFLRLHKAPLNDQADPEKLPYYLLIVGDPETIPYSFQQQLDVVYAVGRIWFDDPKDFGHYARSVVAAETSLSRPRRAAFFAPSHRKDLVSRLSARELTAPLAKWVKKKCPSWKVETWLGPKATRDQLGRLLGGDETPAFLFTAGHGVCYSLGDSRQEDGQGALVCADWGGKGTPVEPAQSFGKEDAVKAANVAGLITFHFACDSAGTSKMAPFTLGSPVQAANRSFMASMSRRLLTHPQGGALAVIGHVGGAWRSSFQWPGAEGQSQAFEDMIELLLKGKRIGDAMETFGLRYAGQATEIVDRIREEKEWEIKGKNEDIARYWSAAFDTRGFVVVGDPAVRLSV